jgi:lipopolysaccharide export LptBFGC system permease protein LptF
LCNLSLLLTCILIGLLFFLSDTMSGGKSQRVHYLIGIYLPLVQLLLIFLATVFIKKDEKLVRSADRLR